MSPPRPTHPRHPLIRNLRAAPQQQTQQSRRQYAIEDTAGNLRVGIGALGAYDSSLAGDYGVMVGDPTGNVQELWPPSAVEYAPQITVTSNSWTLLSNVPTLSAYIGASANAIVTISSTIQTTSAACYLLVVANGQTPTGTDWTIQEGVDNPISCSASALATSNPWTALEPGEVNTFNVWASNTGAGYFSYFLQTCLIVQPI
jgi:hypothetical protein